MYPAAQVQSEATWDFLWRVVYLQLCLQMMHVENFFYFCFVYLLCLNQLYLLIRGNSMMEIEYVWIWLIWGPFSINSDYFLPYMVWWHLVTSLFSFLVIWIDSIWINPIDISFPTFQSVLTRAKLFIFTQIFYILLRHVSTFTISFIWCFLRILDIHCTWFHFWHGSLTYKKQSSCQ